jgi:hypothetical protein
MGLIISRGAKFVAFGLRIGGSQWNVDYLLSPLGAWG